MAANRKQQAIAALQEMAAVHQNEFIDFIYSPIFAEIRDAPAFTALLTQYSLHAPCAHLMMGAGGMETDITLDKALRKPVWGLLQIDC